MFLRILSILAVSSLVSKGVAQQPPTESLNDWLERQETIALQGISANIGPDGSRVLGASNGIIVASPSKSEPDCKYIPPLKLKVIAYSCRSRLLHMDTRCCVDDQHAHRTLHPYPRSST